jgi:pimeloyl-ACP methyl ester carboxylesterase
VSLLAAAALKLFLDVLFVGGILVAVWGIWMFFRQPRIVFKPNRELMADPSDFGLAFHDVDLPVNGHRVHGWWLFGDDPRKVILCFVGAHGNISHELPTVAFLKRLGASILLIDYPGYGKSEGRPTERGCYLAAASAWDYAIGEKGIRPEDVIVFGRSLGGTVAAWLAARHPECARLVIHSAFTSVPDIAAREYPFFPVRYFCYIRFNTLKQVRACRVPVIVMHPKNDAFIPFRHGERVFQAAPEPKRFMPLHGGHHGSEWQKTPGLLPALRSLVMGEAEAWA